MRYSSILCTGPNSISIFSDPFYSPTPLKFHLFYAPLQALLYVSWHSQQTSASFHLKNIHFYSFSTSHSPCHCSVQRRWYNYSFINSRQLFVFYPISSIAQYIFMGSSRFISLYPPFILGTTSRSHSPPLLIRQVIYSISVPV